ncbi:hypothetical protein H5410_013406 [Solanum commersonii]|uniref:Uncharacterized protein n=1 Tax=Solanum commersonii TaxID=4109 RepID=A0A9J6AUS9_SOLCO|nr:hypothetical protein H5410_013406 [Solanum commersonii]
MGLKNLNRKEFMGIRQKIEKTRSDLQVLQEIITIQREGTKRKAINYNLCWQKITHPTEIKTKNINFYKGLMGSSTHKLLTIYRTIMRTGTQLTHDQQLALCDEVTKWEIKSSLWSIGNDKAPSVDEYNALLAFA